MPLDAPSITAAAKGDGKRVVSLLVLAFCDDPVVRFMYPRAEAVLERYPRFINAFGGAASLQAGETWILGDDLAAAVWLPPGVDIDHEEIERSIAEDVFPDHRADFAATLGELEPFIPAEPHWFLPLIGVDVHRRGQGGGTALLTAAADRLDLEQATAFLTSTNVRNNPLYERFGFELLGSVSVGATPPFFPMVRRPRPASAAG